MAWPSRKPRARSPMHHISFVSASRAFMRSRHETVRILNFPMRTNSIVRECYLRWLSNEITGRTGKGRVSVSKVLLYPRDWAELYPSLSTSNGGNWFGSDYWLLRSRFVCWFARINKYFFLMGEVRLSKKEVCLENPAVTCFCRPEIVDRRYAVKRWLALGRSCYDWAFVPAKSAAGLGEHIAGVRSALASDQALTVRQQKQAIYIRGW